MSEQFTNKKLNKNDYNTYFNLGFNHVKLISIVFLSYKIR
ncbi:hypothetical protein SAMN05660226_01969 [Parapedobacter luteus]|uniref:Uncharacterized protein n=1 Tax=Parapedobacter luteus TaxID=623280 RepID=A0A1T5C8S4_9SPHI|nr:hypothetical protein SAMN05660226_01969 [Parapedobacter luteus]